MTSELRETGISAFGDVGWGTHFCFFYETKRDLLDILVPYFKAGLDNNEFCLLVRRGCPRRQARRHPGRCTAEF
jgi:DcmR-like sensory protein